MSPGAATSPATAIAGAIPPADFSGRQDLISQVEQSIGQRVNVCLAGGPKTGKTSLLRYIAANAPSGCCGAFLSGDFIGSLGNPTHFWKGVLRALRGRVPTERQPTIANGLQKIANAPLDVFDLEDLFDPFGESGTPVVLFVDDFDRLLGNPNFWPPDDFFHHARSFGQRDPRGLIYVITTPRPLLELWDASKGASPFYNIFGNLPVGWLAESDIRAYVIASLKKVGLPPDRDVEDKVISWSRGHPGLAGYVTALCVSMLTAQKKISEPDLQKAITDPYGPVVALSQQIRAMLRMYEKELLETWQQSPNALDNHQKDQLRSLRDYGLLPLGMVI